MRHSAWLSTSPRKPDPNERKDSSVPRYKSLEGTPRAELPTVDGAEHLLEILFDIGPVVSNGFGASPISEQEIWCWQQNRQTPLSSWECATIRQLSKEYANMLQDAQDPSCPPPFVGTGDVDISVIKKQTDSFFAQMEGIAAAYDRTAGGRK